MNQQLVGIEILSLDIWMTLIKPHQLHKQERAKALRAHLKADSIPMEEFLSIMSRADAMIDDKSDQNGVQYGLRERMEAVMQMIPQGCSITTLTDDDVERFDKISERLITVCLPVLLEGDLISTLKKIAEEGIKIAVVSNTGFINGVHMRTALEILGLSAYISFFVFSNEVGASKPNPKMFNKLSDMAGVDPSKVLHIGDNQKADVNGAAKAGMNSLLYDPEGKTANGIASLKSLL